MADYILQILKSNIMIVFSWGFNTPKAIDNGLEFNVEGFKHHGKVRVQYNEGMDVFEVLTFKVDGTIKEKVNDVYADCLVSVIDNLVEKTENYEEQIKKEYSLS